MPNLTERIRKINPEAADLFAEMDHGGALRLDKAFLWKKTEQGAEYWADISLKLGE